MAHWKGLKAGDERVSSRSAYAAWKVWSESSTKKGLRPHGEATASRAEDRARKAVSWNGSGKLGGRHGGLVGSHVLQVLHALLFDFLNYTDVLKILGRAMVKKQSVHLRQRPSPTGTLQHGNIIIQDGNIRLADLSGMELGPQAFRLRL